MTLLETGRIVKPHGVKGEVRAEVWCDAPDDLLSHEHFYAKDGKKMCVQRARVHRGQLHLKLEGVDDVATATSLVGTVLCINRDGVLLPPGSYFVCDLLGLTVVDALSGEEYGIVEDVQQTGANDVYHLRSEIGRLLLVPAIPEVIAEVDLANRVIRITPLKGLFEL